MTNFLYINLFLSDGFVIDPSEFSLRIKWVLNHQLGNYLCPNRIEIILELTVFKGKRCVTL